MGYVSHLQIINIAIQLNTLQGICVHLQIISIAIQLNTLQWDIVHLQLLYGSGLMGWWTIIPLTYYSHSTEYIASGICVHLQIINIAIQLNTFQVDMCPLADYCMFLLMGWWTIIH